MHKQRVGVLLAFALAGGLAACSESLEGGAACAVLCPDVSVQVRDTTIEAVALDTTLSGYPIPGTEGFLLLASRGDSLDSRAVVRFDTLQLTYRNGGLDSAITAVDSAYLHIRVDVVNAEYTAPVRIDLYDVDTTALDTALSALKPLFRPERIVGGVTLDSTTLKDSIRVPIFKAALQAKIDAKTRFRLGIRATSAKPVQLRLLSRESGTGPIMRYDPSPDTAIRPLEIQATSRSPADVPSLALDLTDFTLVFKALSDFAPGLFAVGGLPGQRTYLRFEIPSLILDSSQVLRATLLLTQRPNRIVDANKQFGIYPLVVAAGTQITDLQRSAVLLVPAVIVGIDSIRLAPSDSGVRSIEMVNAVRSWANQDSVVRSQRAITLLSGLEGSSPAEALFFSIEAPPALRPRLRIGYVPRGVFGVP